MMNEEQEITQHVGRIAQDMMKKIFEPIFGHARKRKLEDEAKFDGVFAAPGRDHDRKESRQGLG
jgi:hypothetical protein